MPKNLPEIRHQYRREPTKILDLPPAERELLVAAMRNALQMVSQALLARKSFPPGNPIKPPIEKQQPE